MIEKKKKIKQSSYEEIAKLYDDLFPSDPVYTCNEIESLIYLLNEENINISNSVIADIGGGTGRLAIPLSKMSKKVILVEPFENLINIARNKEKYTDHGLIEYIQEGFLNISLPDNSVDIIISFGEAFQYILTLKEQIKALKNIYSIIRPGGLVLFDNMNFFSINKKNPNPRRREWENETHKFKRNTYHKLLPFNELWINKENIRIVEKNTGKEQKIISIHKLKMFSPSELCLLFNSVGFEKIQKFSGPKLKSTKGSRIWIKAVKPQ